MNNVNAVYSSHPHFAGQQFGGNISTNGIDLSQYQQQRLADGQPHSQSPSLQHTPFQVPSVVPAKRPRPGEDNAGTPSQLGPGAHSRSRSQTPQQQYPPFSGQPQNQQFHTPTTMQHMQQNMSPSPAHQQQPYRPPTMGPYNQIQQMNRAGNPQDRMGMPPNAAQQAFMRQNSQVPGQGNPGMGGQSSAGVPQASMSQLQMQQEAMRRQYQARLAQTQQQLQGHLPQASQGGPSGSMGDLHRTSWGNGANGQAPTRPPMPQVSNQGDGSQEQAFIKSLAHFHEQRERHLNPDPRVCGHPISYFRLFRRYAEINPGTSPQAWAAVAAGLGLPQDQDARIIRELRMIFEQDLQAFYFLYYRAMRDRKLKSGQGQPQSGGLMGLQGSPQQANDHMPHVASTPSASITQSQPQPATTQAASPDLQNNLMLDDQSERPGLVQKKSAGKISSIDKSEHHTSDPLLPQINNAEQNQVEPAVRPSSSEQRPLSVGQTLPATNGGVANHREVGSHGLANESSHEYTPSRRPLTTYGGIDLEGADFTGSRLHDLKTFPRYEELGVIDLHVINLCLQSGFEAEFNYALDQLAVLSQHPLVLARCEDLLDTLVDFGDEQIRAILKAEGSSATPTGIQSFDQLTKSSLLEVEAVQSSPVFGEAAYQREHAIERLLAVTTVLRNLSFPVHEAPPPDRDVDSNSKLLTSSAMKTFMTNVVKVLAAGLSCFRTARNTQDLMKDLITLCSNIADNLVLSSEDEARSFLQFLVAFAPVNVGKAESQALRFSSFDPVKHHYLPCAVDSLAKLLARDDPNRNLCRSVFASEISTTSRGALDSLLTRAFALAVAPIPDGSSGTFSTNAATHLAGRRRPLLSQGMLAADILSSLVPGTATVTLSRSRGKQSLERAWLESGDAWASRLMRLVVAMAMSDSQGVIQRDSMTQAVVDDSSRGFVTITQRALSMLRRLVNRSDMWDANNGEDLSQSASLAIFGAVPLDEVLFSAVSIPRFDMETMKGLTALASLSKGN